MKSRFCSVGLCIFCCAAMIACERNRGVYAGNDEAQTYQPRKAELNGELWRIDVPRQTFVIRVENGMAQTFKFGDSTVVTGPDPSSNITINDLVGKEGSEVTVKWRDENGSRMATSVEVTLLINSKNGLHPKRKH